MPAPPLPHSVWIHAPFRSCGTYIWEEFRRREEYTCFYEPFHEYLAGDLLQWQKQLSEAEFNKMRHGDIAENYFKEYPLSSNGAAVGYETLFAVPETEEGPKEFRDRLQAYLQGLIQHAGNQKAVFKCCRGALRARWLSETFPSTVIGIIRDPRDQFQSYHSFSTGYFHAIHLLWTIYGAKHPLISPLARRLDFRAPSGFNDIHHLILTCQYMARALPEPVLYTVFYYWWWIQWLETLPVSNMLIDTSCEMDPATLEDKINEMNLNISVSRFYPRKYREHIMPSHEMTKIEEGVERMIARNFPDKLKIFSDHFTTKLSCLSDPVREKAKRLISTPRETELPTPDRIPVQTTLTSNILYALYTSVQDYEKRSEKMAEVIESLNQTLDLEKARFEKCETYAKSLERHRFFWKRKTKQ